MKGFAGCELSLDSSRSRFERMYARVLGAPANGLRIRLRRVLPATGGSFRDILDAGCGHGVFSFELAKAHREAQVLGIDMDPVLVARANAIAQRAGLTNCRFEVGDVTKLEYDTAFDLVVSVDNLEHVDDDVTALRGLMRALRPGGRAVVHVPGYERRWLVFGRRVNFDVPGHVRPGYRTNELVERLDGAGFDLSSCRSTYGILETFTNNVSYLITGADQKRKGPYALVFPFLLAVSWFGKSSRPAWGAGVLAVAERPVQIGEVKSATADTPATAENTRAT
jgi:SAM-dependent methyltransferase